MIQVASGGNGKARDSSEGIAAVAAELGVSARRLRAWERRYRVVVPRRGRRGERVYDADQIELLRRVVAAIDGGAGVRAAHEAVAPRPVRTVRLQVAASPEAPQLARWAADELLEDEKDTQYGFDLRLAVNEIVKNAVLYGSAPIRIEMKLLADHAELRVENAGDPVSMKGLRARRAGRGRGLEIVDLLSEAWSIDASPDGTEVTVRLPISRAPATRAGAVPPGRRSRVAGRAFGGNGGRVAGGGCQEKSVSTRR